jgi:hypothetical protein|tara:strand:+ start:1665 stop:1832 length:168 start_codon:yes stop_codon:yes gene_type:complete
MKLKEIAKSYFSLYGNKIILKLFLAADISDSYFDWVNNQEVIRFSNQRFFYAQHE